MLAAMIGMVPLEAHADWREEIGTFRIGITAAHDLTRDPVARAEVAKAYSAALGMPVEISVLPDYATLIRAQRVSAVQYALYSATAYTLAWQICECVEPLVAPVSSQGATGIRSVLVFREPAPDTVDDIANYRVAIGLEDSLTSRAIPLSELKPGGLALSGTEAFLVGAESAAEAERLFVEGKVDGLFGWALDGASTDEDEPGTTSRLRAAGMAESDFSVLWTSKPYRFGPHAVRNDLNAEAVATLRDFLLSLEKENPDVFELLETSRQGGFSAVSHDDYKPLLNVLSLPDGKKPEEQDAAEQASKEAPKP